MPGTRRRDLSCQTIVQSAIGLADSAGLSALTMQGVAQALGSFTPMSLYRYVHNKDGLVDLMLDAVLGEVELPHWPVDDWRAAVHDLELRTWDALERHPWYAQLVHTRPPLGPNALKRTEFLLAAFHSIGADLGTAMGYVSLVERLVLGLAAQSFEEARAQPEVDFSTPAGASAALAPLRALTGASDAYPNLGRWAAAPSGPNARAQLQLGLELILGGIAGRHARP